MKTALLNNFNTMVRDCWLFLMLLLVFSSFVIAESRLKLDFSDEFYHNKSTDIKITRDKNMQKKQNSDAPEWRQPTKSSTGDSRWEDIQLLHDEHEEYSSQMLLDRFSNRKQIDLEPQFNLRF